MLAFTALTAVLTFPLSVEPASRALALSADTRLFLWTLSWDVHALLRQPLRLFDANIFHPEPRTLAYSEHLVGSAFLSAPFLLATGNPVLALNVVVLLSCVLSGAGAYFLARELGIGRSGALAAGVVFAFAPPRFTRLAQLHLATVQWIPFCLAFVHRYLRERKRRDLLAAIGLFTLQSLTSGHGGLFLLLAGGAGLVVTSGWLVWKAGRKVAFYSLAHRVVGIILLSLRLFLAFQLIGVALPFMKAFPVTLAIIAGSAASITPAGLGISEMLGALIAGVVQLNPAAAFVAIGLDRALALLVSGLGVLVFHARYENHTRSS